MSQERVELHKKTYSQDQEFPFQMSRTKDSTKYTSQKSLYEPVMKFNKYKTYGVLAFSQQNCLQNEQHS